MKLKLQSKKWELRVRVQMNADPLVINWIKYTRYGDGDQYYTQLIYRISLALLVTNRKEFGENSQRT